MKANKPKVQMNLRVDEHIAETLRAEAANCGIAPAELLGVVATNWYELSKTKREQAIQKHLNEQHSN